MRSTSECSIASELATISSAAQSSSSSSSSLMLAADFCFLWRILCTRLLNKCAYDNNTLTTLSTHSPLYQHTHSMQQTVISTQHVYICTVIQTSPFNLSKFITAVEWKTKRMAMVMSLDTFSILGAISQEPLKLELSNLVHKETPSKMGVAELTWLTFACTTVDFWFDLLWICCKLVCIICQQQIDHEEFVPHLTHTC